MTCRSNECECAPDCGNAASAEDVPQIQHRQADSASQDRSCKTAIQAQLFREGFESVQVETSDNQASRAIL